MTCRSPVRERRLACQVAVAVLVAVAVAVAMAVGVAVSVAVAVAVTSRRSVNNASIYMTCIAWTKKVATEGAK